MCGCARQRQIFIYSFLFFHHPLNASKNKGKIIMQYGSKLKILISKASNPDLLLATNATAKSAAVLRLCKNVIIKALSSQKRISKKKKNILCVSCSVAFTMFTFKLPNALRRSAVAVRDADDKRQNVVSAACDFLGDAGDSNTHCC